MPNKDVSVARYFADLPDPRIDRTGKHSLTDILVIAPRAVVRGAGSWEEVAAFGEAEEGRLGGFPALPNGIPSHDTFYRVFARPDPQAFGACVGGRRAAACEAAGPEHVAVDGPAVRAAPRGAFGGCLHLVRAWAAENRLILGQAAVAGGSHPIAAVPELLRVLALKGALVTLAAGRQEEVARQIRAAGGDDLLAVRGTSRPATAPWRRCPTGRARPSPPGSSATGARRSRAGTGGTGSGPRPRSATRKGRPRTGRAWRRWCGSGGSGR